MTLRASQLRFVAVAPIGRDGDLISAFLTASGYACSRADSIADVVGGESESLLGLIVTDESLTGDGLDALRSVIHAQPGWSDLPILLLTSGTSEPQYAALASQARMEIRSLFLLDRPVRKEMLLSAVQVAYTARLKQLDFKDAAVRQTQSDEALRNSEKLAVAGRLAATMAHEVNNPLEALGNLLYLIENCSKLDEVRSLGSLARQELQRISEIVDHTLRFHRAPSKPACTDVCELASSALTLFSGKIRERRIVPRFVGEKTEAYCSAGEIRQALVNLIGNAIDAMPNGGRLIVKVSSVSLKGTRHARLTVADSGCGMSKEVKSRLFTQFFTTKGSRGTGIGLWLTNDIVARNQGMLRFRSCTESPSGSVFSMYLPCAQIHAVDQMGPPHSEERLSNEEAA